MSNAGHFKMKPQLEVSIDLKATFKATIYLPIPHFKWRIPLCLLIDTEHGSGLWNE